MRKPYKIPTFPLLEAKSKCGVEMSLPTERTKVDDKGRVTLPSRMRKALCIKKGDLVEVFLYKNNLLIRLLTPEPIKTFCLNCGKSEDETKMAYRSSDGRYGVCVKCDAKGFHIMAVK